jgi:hypothetical protein
MLAILFLAGSVLLGACGVRCLMRQVLDTVEQIIWGLVTGSIAGTLGIFLIARWQGQLTPRLVFWATLTIWVMAAVLAVIEQLRRPWSFPSLWESKRPYEGLAIVLVLIAPFYWRLLSAQVFRPGPGGIYSGSGGNDLNFHAALISSFLYGQNFPPTYTLLPPEPLFYPYLPDFHAAVLMTGGLSLRSSLMVTALLFGAAIAGLFYSFALRITRLPRTATLATLLFLLNGGLGCFYFLDDWWQSEKSAREFWNTLAFNYAKLSERGIHWTNIVADMMVPQRTSLFGLSIGLMIFTIFAILWQRWSGDEQLQALDGKVSGSLTLMMIAGALAGLLPLFHTHTYIAVGLVSIILFIVQPRRDWVAFWAPAVLLAAPQLFNLAAHAKGSGIVRPFFGWLGHDDPFFPTYLLRNFGLPLLLAIPAWWVAPKPWRKFYLPFLFLFVFSFAVVFSPNLYDNGKMLYYWHAFNSVLVAGWLMKLTRNYWQRLLAAVLAFFSVATALIVFHSETVISKLIFTDEEVAAAAFIREHTGPQSLFLTAPALNPPALSLGGRPNLRGATAWLWSHGYEFRDRENDVRRIYAGTRDAFELLHYYQVDYIYLGSAEHSDLRADTAFFEGNFPVVYQSQTIKIFDARKSRDKPARGPTAQSPRELTARLELDPFSLLVEFPRTSFFVYRLCQASYGRMPRREEFMTGMTLLGRGLFIGTPDWQESLEKNRNYLLGDWTKSVEFRKLYEGKSDDEFVDHVLKNAGLNWSQSQRDALVNNLGTKTVSRPAALLRIVDDSDFYAREYSNAWVLAHFFGYLRRNPDDAPDFDLKGFNFWRDRLDSWKDYRTISLAFIESDEYRNMKLAP